MILKILGKSWKNIRKSRVQNGSFPKNLIIANEEITHKKSMSEKINCFFCEHWYKSGSMKMSHGTTSFESYLPNITTIFRENCLTEEEFKNPFFH